MQTKNSAKDEIIKFVLEATEEQNTNLATFIAGMQAQKQVNKQTQKPVCKTEVLRETITA